MAISRVQSASNSGSSVNPLTVAYTSNNTAGNFLGLVIGLDTGITIDSITDTRSNTWNLAAQRDDTVLQGAIYYAMNCGAGANTVTINFNLPTNAVVIVVEYSGVATSLALDETASNFGTGTALSSGSTAVTDNQEELLLFGGVVFDSTATFTAGGSFTEVAELGANTYAVQMAERIVLIAGSYTGTATSSVSGSWIALLATFRAAAASFDAANFRFARSLDPVRLPPEMVCSD